VTAAVVIIIDPPVNDLLSLGEGFKVMEPGTLFFESSHKALRDTIGTGVKSQKWCKFT